MAEKLEIYKCEVCGNIVEVLHGGAGDLVCCGKPMVHFVANTVDAAKEKHVPVVEKSGGGVTVKVGSVPHPMEDKHYIEWIEVLGSGEVCRHELKPGDAPEASCCCGPENPVVRAYCNLHGLWKA